LMGSLKMMIYGCLIIERRSGHKELHNSRIAIIPPLQGLYDSAIDRGTEKGKVDNLFEGQHKASPKTGSFWKAGDSITPNRKE
jgi:hypothetical protein